MIDATRIRQVRAWEALDSRGVPAVACEVTLAGGATGVAVVPSGASTGTHEALELRDRKALRYGGRGVRAAVENSETMLAEAVAGLDAADWRAVDNTLVAADGTPDLRTLGANAVLAVSLASVVAAASELRIPLYELMADGRVPLLPMPMVNILSGGAHAGGAIDVQDLLAVPIGAASFAEAIEWVSAVRSAAVRVAVEEGLNASLVADEGGLGLLLDSNRAGLDLLMRAIDLASLQPGTDVAIAVDVAATELAVDDGYRLLLEDRTLSAIEMVEMLADWCNEYPIVSIEDGLGEDDWAGWSELTDRVGGRVQVLGDDLLVTDTKRITMAAERRAANAVLLKPNQAGCLLWTRRAYDAAVKAGFQTVLSARSGDTEDVWLADLAVGWRTGQIKVGSTMRSERTAKWNRLLHIERTAGVELELARPFAVTA